MSDSDQSILGRTASPADEERKLRETSLRPTGRGPAFLLHPRGPSGRLFPTLQGNGMDKSATGQLEQQGPAQPAKKPAERGAPGQEHQVSPRAGRTGGLGARAERPSEDCRLKATPRTGRGAKAPSAAEAPAEDGSDSNA